MKALIQRETGSADDPRVRWGIFAVAVVTNFMLTAGRFSFSALLKPISLDLAISRAVSSGMLSVVMITYALASPGVGYLSHRFGFRSVVLSGSIIAFSGFILAGFAEAAWQLYLFYGVLFGVGSATFYSLPISEVRKWFGTRSGLILALVSTAGALGIWAGPPLADYLVRSIDWRAAFLFLGVLGMVLVVPSTCIATVPLGERNPYEGDVGKYSLTASSLSTSQALRTKNFWLLTFSYALFGVGQFIVLTHTLPYATDQGLNSAHAAVIVSFLGGIGIPARLIVGWWVDRSGRRLPLIVLLFLQTVSVLFILPFRSICGLWAFVLVYGFCYGSVLSQFGGLMGDIFGTKALSVIFGWQTLSIGLAGAFGSWIGGFIFDITGSYYFAYLVVFFTSLASALFLILGVRDYSSDGKASGQLPMSWKGK